jgi:hypothetical protein
MQIIPGIRPKKPLAARTQRSPRSPPADGEAGGPPGRESRQGDGAEACRVNAFMRPGPLASRAILALRHSRHEAHRLKHQESSRKGFACVSGPETGVFSSQGLRRLFFSSHGVRRLLCSSRGVRRLFFSSHGVRRLLWEPHSGCRLDLSSLARIALRSIRSARRRQGRW